MGPKDVLLDFLNDNARRTLNVLEDCDDDCLYWQPDPEANSIAVTIWHSARVQDLLQRLARGTGQDAELWFSGGWAEQTGYDPRGIGANGWGTVVGYTKEEVDGMPDFDYAVLKAYFSAVCTAARTYLNGLDEDGLQQLRAGFGEERTVYQLLKTSLLDMTRHVGEIYALRAMWERQL